MKRILWTVLILGAVTFFPSCTTYHSITFDRLQAAEVNYPEQIRTVGIINYLPLQEVKKKSLENTSGTLEGDGKVAAEVLAQEIAATNYFNQVVICDSVIRKSVSDADWSQPLSGYKADSLIESLGVDMLFSVERVHVQLEESNLFLPNIMVQVPVIDGIVTPLIRAYVPGRHTPLFTFSKTDTIYWEMRPDLTQERVIKDASEYAGMLPARHLLPHWKEVERYYFDGGVSEMRDAGIYVREQNWEEAASLWQSLYDSKKGKNKMYAAYNLALYYEMQDELEKAREYLDVALSLAKEESWEKQMIVFYQVQLEEEAQKNRHLKIQMKRFEL